MFRLIEELSKELRCKEALITELSGEKTTLTLRVGELEVQVEELSSSLLQKDKDVEVYTHIFTPVLNLHMFLSASYPLLMYVERKTQPQHNFYEPSNITAFLWTTLSPLVRLLF